MQKSAQKKSGHFQAAKGRTARDRLDPPVRERRITDLRRLAASRGSESNTLEISWFDTGTTTLFVRQKLPFVG
jgi:hypothetical protein